MCGAIPFSVFNMNIWYQKNLITLILYPLSLLYRVIISLRQFLYQKNIFKSHRVSVPVIIVGNITVGGTGKTPLVIALVDVLKKNGFHPGIISRGYRGKSKTWPRAVNAKSNPMEVGDEPVLLAKNTDVPVVVGPNRVATAQKLLADFQCDVIVSDDGLQHYALARDIEIVVIDASRRFGNGFCLPAGPLRESINRLKTADFIVANGAAHTGEFQMDFELVDIVNVQDESKTINFSDCENKKITVIAGIGNTERFFSDLRNKQLKFSKHVFPDHYFFQKKDFENLTDEIILMTEKDAIRCRDFCDARYWAVRGRANLSDDMMRLVMKKLSLILGSPYEQTLH